MKDFTFVQTSPCGRGEHHPHGMVGHLFRIRDPESVNIGNCFMAGRLKEGDLWLCVRHAGDYFQNYIYVREASNCITGMPELNFGSYGIGDAEKIELDAVAFEQLKKGKAVHFESEKPEADTRVYIPNFDK